MKRTHAAGLALFAVFLFFIAGDFSTTASRSGKIRHQRSGGTRSQRGEIRSQHPGEIRSQQSGGIGPRNLKEIHSQNLEEIRSQSLEEILLKPATPALNLLIPGIAKRQEREIAQSALDQIEALLAEKQSRTASQQKIDSQLLYAIRMRRGDSVAPGVQALAVDVGADDAGQVTVDVTAAVDDQLLRELARMGIEISNVFPEYHSLRAVASLDQLEESALPALTIVAAGLLPVILLSRTLHEPHITS